MCVCVCVCGSVEGYECVCVCVCVWKCVCVCGSVEGRVARAFVCFSFMFSCTYIHVHKHFSPTATNTFLPPPLRSRTGAVVAAGLSQGKSTSIPFLDTNLFKQFRNDVEKRVRCKEKTIKPPSCTRTRTRSLLDLFPFTRSFTCACVMRCRTLCPVAPLLA